jgi:hypothetical protein
MVEGVRIASNLIQNLRTYYAVTQPPIARSKCTRLAEANQEK